MKERTAVIRQGANNDNELVFNVAFITVNLANQKTTVTGGETLKRGKNTGIVWHSVIKVSGKI